MEPSVIHNTFVVERSYPVAPAKVFAAFADLAKKRRWFAEGEGHDSVDYALEFAVGGKERLRYTLGNQTPMPGLPIEHEATHIDILPECRVVTIANMRAGGRLISSALVTIELREAHGGTDLICTHQAIFYEGADGPEMRERGWSDLFDRLGRQLAPELA